MPPRWLGTAMSRRWRPRLPRRTVRLRLTLLYGGLFLVSGAALLAITYGLVQRATGSGFLPSSGPPTAYAQNSPSRTVIPPTGTGAALTPQQAQAQTNQIQAQAAHQHAAEMHQLLINSGVALLIMAVISIGLGWLVAGRVLRPLRTITTSAREISATNLHQRLALPGPEDELKELGDTIDSVLARLEASFQAQRRFIANASHELRTPLTMMRTALDVATAKPGPGHADAGVLAGKIRVGLDKADRLVDGFLALARTQHDTLADAATVRLDDTVSVVLAERHAQIATAGITTEQHCQQTTVRGSDVLLTHMIENVVDNAVRYNVPGGWLRISSANDATLARLTVENSGPVLDEREVRQLAQPFRRLTPDRTNSDGGTGLGLSIVAAVAATHGGTLDLHARVDGGLRVVITLPLATRTADTTRMPA